MSVHGISNSRLIPTPLPQSPATTGAGTFGIPSGASKVPTTTGVGIGSQPSQTTGTSTPTAPASSQAATSSTGRTPGALSATPPQGTDPALWSVLTSDERSHFAKLGAMGPLTYGRVLSQGSSAQIPSARGGRLDVKV